MSEHDVIDTCGELEDLCSPCLSIATDAYTDMQQESFDNEIQTKHLFYHDYQDGSYELVGQIMEGEILTPVDINDIIVS